MIVGLLHPGEMRSAVGGALRANGHDVVWTSEGRSPATRARAVAFRDAIQPRFVDGAISGGPDDPQLYLTKAVFPSAHRSAENEVYRP